MSQTYFNPPALTEKAGTFLASRLVSNMQDEDWDSIVDYMLYMEERETSYLRQLKELEATNPELRPFY